MLLNEISWCHSNTIFCSIIKERFISSNDGFYTSFPHTTKRIRSGLYPTACDNILIILLLHSLSSIFISLFTIWTNKLFILSSIHVFHYRFLPLYSINIMHFPFSNDLKVDETINKNCIWIFFIYIIIVVPQIFFNHIHYMNRFKYVDYGQ